MVSRTTLPPKNGMLKRPQSYPFLQEAMFILLLADHLLLETVELDGFLIQFIYSVHKTAKLAFQNRSEE
jgi:hypothetical protein